MWNHHWRIAHFISVLLSISFSVGYLSYQPTHYNDIIMDSPLFTQPCAGNSPGTGEFPAQKASNVENVSIWWRHHVLLFFCGFKSSGNERYVKLWVAHAPRMAGAFSPPGDMHNGTGATHVPWYMPESLTSSFIWGRWQGKRFRYSQRMRNPQLNVSGKRHMIWYWTSECIHY